MPITKYFSLAEAEADLPVSPTAEAGILTALALNRLDLPSRLGIRVSQTGIHRYATVGEGEADRERFTRARLREALEGSNPQTLRPKSV
jgi:hypothetical protein